MCGEDLYTETPPITVGGVGSTLYSVTAPIPDCRWAEYKILAISSADSAGQYSCIVTDKSNSGIANIYPYTNAQQYGKDGSGTGIDYAYGQPCRIAATTTIYPNDEWNRISNSEKKVYVYVDPLPNNGVMYITLKLRMRKFTTIPGPSHAGHHDHMEEVNKARAETTTQRLKDMGVPGYAEEKKQP